MELFGNFGYSRFIKRMSLSKKDRTALLKFNGEHGSIKNLGQTCYLSSVLQALYADVIFRREFIAYAMLDERKERLAHVIKTIFVALQKGEYNLDTTALVHHLKMSTGDDQVCGCMYISV